ncbi:uncharacterized protein LOC111640505 isoform X1 [Centruroides sculpturatus]|uniref:uncharacterized protein LOC111640505 isoform X1 n=2 Tax=Centruroides sculpturatus TaxID=218467 RepID=UPI000C6CAF50|nr:uncharacterized protein LOC111640505 isoform X1 [Centruroides sculpturatus]
MAQVLDAIVKEKVVKLRDRFKPPINDNIYKHILKLLKEKVEQGKTSSLTKMPERVRRFWKIHGKEFVDITDLTKYFGRLENGIMVKTGRILLSESLAIEIISKYALEHGKETSSTIHKDLQSKFELPLPFIQTYVKKAINEKVEKNRKWSSQKLQERLSEAHKQAIMEAVENITQSDSNNLDKSLTTIKLVQMGEIESESGETSKSTPLLLIHPKPKRKAKQIKCDNNQQFSKTQFPIFSQPPLSSWQEHPRNLIPELCRQFYHLEWLSGTGGGISIRHGNEIYIAPSGVQKERIQPEDLFIQDLEERFISGPASHKKLKKSECTPLFMNAYTMRGAGAVIHSHSKNAVLATLLYPGKEFQITHQEMIKGIKKGTTGTNYRYDDLLIVPIIENTPFEKDLKDSMAQAMEEYPDTCAVLVRRHGIYVWGDTWERAKTMCECYDYLFDIAVRMKQMGLDPTARPSSENVQHVVTVPLVCQTDEHGIATAETTKQTSENIQVIGCLTIFLTMNIIFIIIVEMKVKSNF